MGISQSGQSPDIVSVIEEGKQQGRPTLAITNDLQSPLAKKADHVISLRTGIEEAVAATKTYTSTLTALALFSIHFDADNEGLKEIINLPDAMEQTLAETKKLLPRVERYRYMDHCVVIGRGFNYATAFEIALKIKELTRTVSEPYSSADFLHGPIAMVGKGFPILIIAPHGSVFEDMKKILARVKDRHSEIILISNEPDLGSQAHLMFLLPTTVPEWLTPMITVLPGQLFSLSLARIRGLDPDQPAGITKVTETW
jgi:glucosamine--fructose-6-phosphate aminotransferase (isomerizing)